MQLQMKTKKDKDKKQEFEVNWRIFYYMVLAFVIGATLSAYAIASFVQSTSADTFVEVCDRYNGKENWKVVNKTCVPISMIVINDTISTEYP